MWEKPLPCGTASTLLREQRAQVGTKLDRMPQTPLFLLVLAISFWARLAQDRHLKTITLIKVSVMCNINANKGKVYAGVIYEQQCAHCK